MPNNPLTMSPEAGWALIRERAAASARLDKREGFGQHAPPKKKAGAIDILKPPVGAFTTVTLFYRARGDDRMADLLEEDLRRFRKPPLSLAEELERQREKGAA